MSYKLSQKGRCEAALKDHIHMAEITKMYNAFGFSVINWKEET